MMQMDRQVYMRAEAFLSWNAQRCVLNAEVTPVWIAPGERFWYQNRTRRGLEYILVDPAGPTRQLAFDHARLAAALSTASGRAYEAYRLSLSALVFEEQSVAFDLDGRRWRCDLETYTCVEVEHRPANPAELLSPDGQWAAFTRRHNLYIRNTTTNEEIALTHDGKRYYDYGAEAEARLSTVSDQRFGRAAPPVAAWSPDSRKLVTQRLDQRRVRDLHLIQHAPPDGSARPVLYAYRYPLVGDQEVPLAEYVVLDVEKRTQTFFEMQPEIIQFEISPLLTGLVWWSQDSQRAYYIQQERGFRTLRLYEVDAGTGASRLLAEEHGQTNISYNLAIINPPNVRILEASRAFIWFSQRDGWAHLYLYDLESGQLRHQITQGAWNVLDILRVDEERGLLYFTGCGREPGVDPYYEYLYRVGLNGGEVELLTPEDAAHKITLSPSGRYFVDTFSRVDLPPVTVLRTMDGELVQKLEEADVQLLLEKGWRFPERFSVKARDGVTDIYGVIYRPTNFDPDKQYPVLDAIYPGPHIIRTPKSFPTTPREAFRFWGPQAEAELGFIVITIDGLGTPFRSKAFLDVSYQNTHEAGGLEDHIAGLKQLAARYPYMDLERVGIYGHSGGGYASARAILAYPDFYKVAVSSAGGHDHRGYFAGWFERYQGLLEGDNYNAQDNTLIAHQLKGKLLLAWGELDDNVHPSMCIRLADALIKANKDFDMLLLPNRNHGFSSDLYFTRRRWDYLVQHLLGMTPPEGYSITQTLQSF